MKEIDWSKAPEGAEFYAMRKFWRLNDEGWCECYESSSWCGVGLRGSDVLKVFRGYQERPKQKEITEIRVGDFIHKDELDTEEKYNDVMRVFERFGFSKLVDDEPFNLFTDLFSKLKL